MTASEREVAIWSRLHEPVTDSTRPWVSGTGGGQLGYNYQFSRNRVFGVEDDIGAANIHGSRTVGTKAFGAGMTSAYFVAEDKPNWVATATGRLGSAWGRTLWYVKGGAAF